MAYFQIWTDGACSQNGDWVGGWGYAIVKSEDKDEIIYHNSGGEHGTTNNRMEMIAAIEGMKYVAQNVKFDWGDEIELRSDSAYVINCLIQEWYEKWRDNDWTKKGGLKNADLWKELIKWYEWYADNGYFIKPIKIKGHSGIEMNDFVDTLATKALKETRKEV